MKHFRPSWRTFALFNNDDGDEGGSGGGGGGASRSTKLTALKAKYNGDLERALNEMYDVNERFTKRITKLEQERDTALAKVPEGSSVITKADAEELEAYRKLGPVKDLVKKVDLDTANQELAEIKTEKLHHEAARLLGWKPSVTHDLAQTKGLHVEIKDETENGKAVQRVYVRPKADDKAPLVLFTKHVDEDPLLVEYKTALVAKPVGANGVLPKQSSAGGGSEGGSSLVDAHLAKKAAGSKAVTNPLSVAPATAAATTN